MERFSDNEWFAAETASPSDHLRVRIAPQNLPHGKRRVQRVSRSATLWRDTSHRSHQIERVCCTFTALICKSLVVNGAGEGNRTLVTVQSSFSAASVSR